MVRQSALRPRHAGAKNPGQQRTVGNATKTLEGGNLPQRAFGRSLQSRFAEKNDRRTSCRKRIAGARRTTADGRDYPIEHPDFVLAAASDVPQITIEEPDGRQHYLSALLVTSIEHIPSADAKAA